MDNNKRMRNIVNSISIIIIVLMLFIFIAWTIRVMGNSYTIRYTPYIIPVTTVFNVAIWIIP